MTQHMELARRLENGRYDDDEAGLVIEGSILARGRYHTFVNGQHIETTCNKIPKEGLIYLLRAGALGRAQLTDFYLALFSGSVNPSDSWTAANFAENASEITSSTEGYSNSSRPKWHPDTTDPSDPLVANLDNLASYDIVCSSTLDISGAAMLSSDTKGGTSGILLSATRFDNVHTVNDGATFQLGYELELVDV